MQTLSVIFLKEEIPEIKTVIDTMKEVYILSTFDIPNTELIKIEFLFNDPSVLYTIGLLVGIDRAKKMSDHIFKNL